MKKVAEERAEYVTAQQLPKDELVRLIKDLEKQMKEAAKNLEFEKAALLRDQVFELRKQLVLEEDPLHQFAQEAYGSLGRRPSPAGDERGGRGRRGRKPRVRYGK